MTVTGATGCISVGKFAWSFSKLESYENCPKKFSAESITKTSPFTESEASLYGKMVHKKFENRLVKGTKLPLDLLHHEPVMVKLASAKGTLLGEQKLALTSDLKPTGYFDSDVWLRGIVDFVVLNDDRVLVVDHKTGKTKDNTDQVELMLAMFICYYPEIEWGTGTYYWTKTKKFTSTGLLSREDIQGIWSGYLPRVARLYAAIETGTFPPKANYLCKNYCNCKECDYWGI